MNTFGTNKPLGLALSSKLAFLLVVAILLWSVGAPALLNRAHAANLTTISDTLSNSNIGVNAKHVIQFTNATSTSVGQTIKVQFDPGAGSAFAEAFSAATTTDIFFKVNGVSQTVFTGTCGGAGVLATGNYNGGTDENLTFTVCTTAIPASAITIVVGSSTTGGLITNPAAAGSYRILVNGTQDNSGETRVAVLQNVTLTASVNTSFTFTVAGLATTTGFAGNLATTTASSSATSLPFGNLVPNVPTILGQQLTVATNARNGYSVTVQENQPPTSGTGATIDLFSNGATSSYPVLWNVPTNQLDVPSTYGHFGITSDDTDEGTSTNTNEFSGATKWVGNIDQPRVVFSHTGPSDGTTQNKGFAKVGYQIEIESLQEAGNDYTNTITYVATPTF